LWGNFIEDVSGFAVALEKNHTLQSLEFVQTLFFYKSYSISHDCLALVSTECLMLRRLPPDWSTTKASSTLSLHLHIFFCSAKRRAQVFPQSW
jgi:hypothetical protein